MITKLRSAAVVLTGVVVLLGTPLALADPGNGKGQGKKDHHGDNGAASFDYGGKGDGPRIHIGGIQVILGDNRNYWSSGSSLPPGIQKNLARGKPLPPGIAKKLDGRLLQRLPHYDGYDWVQAGTDLILVAVATGIIYEVLNNVLD